MSSYQTVKIQSGATTITGDLYAPTGSAPAGLVVIAYGTDGLEDNERGPWESMIRGYAEALTAQGFYSLIPDYFARTGTQRGVPAAEVLMNKRDEWAAALSDSVQHARSLARVDAGRIGLLGFSLGGHLALHIRAAANPKALVEFFAPMLDSIGAPGHVPHAQIHHGKADALPVTSYTNAIAIEALLKGEGSDVTLFGYEGAGHGFATQDDANKNSRDLSKARTLAFFAANL